MHYRDEAQTKEETGKIYSQTCTSSREQNKDELEDVFIFLTAEPTLSARGPDFVFSCAAAAVVVVVVVVLVWV